VGQHHRHHRAAPGAQALPHLPPVLRSRREGAAPARHHAGGARGAVPLGRLRAMRLPGLPRAHGHPRDPQGRRRDRRAARTARDSARDADRGKGARLQDARRRRHPPRERRRDEPGRAHARRRSDRSHGVRNRGRVKATRAPRTPVPLYTYKAIDADGKSVLGRVDAVNLFDLEQRLSRMGLDLVTGAPTKQTARLIGGAKVQRQDLINFCFHMEQLAGAGVPIVEGLIDLRESVDNLRFREVVSGLIETIEGGKSLSGALADYPEVFSKVFTSLVRSGEQTGKLADVLKSLAESLKWEDELAAQTKKLMMYPAFVGGIVILVTFFLMIYLVPQMVGFIKNMGQAIPLQTVILIHVSNFFVGYWWAIVAMPFVAWFGVKAAAKTNPAIAYALDDLKLRVPLVG